MSQEFMIDGDHEEMVENFEADVRRYARSVAESFPGDFDQVMMHLESEYPELPPTLIDEIAEEVVGYRPPNVYELVTLPPA